MKISIRLWAAVALAVAVATLLPPAGGVVALAPGALGHAPGSPEGGSPSPDLSPLVGGLPPFPQNLTHFVYIVRENHVFDDYLGDCHSTINASCNDNTDYTSQTNHIADVPFLHHWAQLGTVFDNMYSSVDPYSAQAHAYILSADTNTKGGSDFCSTTVQGTGSSTEWGVYNSSSAKSGLCGWSPDGSQDYPSDGSVFDRFTGPHVAQTTTPLPFLVDGDIMWELDSPGCTDTGNSPIPGGLPGNSVALEHVTCTGTQGWWTNTTTGSVNPSPPVVNPTTGIPQELFVCQDFCTSSALMSDQYFADAFVSYLSDYGLPTFSYIRLPDDHPGPKCPGAGVTYDQCIQWNDQSMNLILENIFNASSPWKDNTVVAISQDDTQDGQNGPDHVNDARRFPFVLVASPKVMRTGNPNPASCGLTTGTCGNIVHPTFNTSNVLSVMERVELNVNPTVFSNSLTKLTFPMEVNDQLAEGNPLEPAWRCGDPRVPCGTGIATPVLTSTSISPNPIGTNTGGSVPLTAAALDQGGSPISGATFTWAIYPTSLGTLSGLSGPSTTFTAGSSAGTGHVCENATYSSVTLMSCDPATVSSVPITLASASVSPSSTSVVKGGSANLHGSALNSVGGQVYPSTATFQWTLSQSSLGSLNLSVGTTNVAFVAGSSLGNETVCLNVTYNAATKMACSWVMVVNAPPTLTSGTLKPLSATLGPAGTQTFWAQGFDQFGRTMSASFAWSLSSASLGTLSTTGPGNSTTLTAGAAAGTGKLSVMITSGFGLPIPLNATVTISVAGSISVQGTDTPGTGCAPLSVSLSGTVSGGVGPYSDLWSFGDGTPTLAQNGAAPTTTHDYTSAGSFVPTLTSTDSVGTSKTVALSAVTVTTCSGSTPTASATASPVSGLVPLSVQFTGGVSGGAPPYTWSWNIGGLAAVSTQNATEVFRSAGTFVAHLNVTDSKGQVAGATVTVTASAAAAPTSSSVGPLGVPWLLWGLILATVLSGVAMAVVLIHRHRRPPAEEGYAVDPGEGYYPVQLDPPP